jgi:hypothetical protein
MLPNFEIALEDGAGLADAFHADRIGLAANFYMPGTPSRVWQAIQSAKGAA